MGALEGRVALVTGSSRGSARRSRSASRGRAPRWPSTAATRRRWRRCGARIAAGNGGGGVAAFTAELTSQEGVDGLRDAGEEAFGPLDVVVANAGGSPVRPGPVEELSEEDFRRSVT